MANGFQHGMGLDWETPQAFFSTEWKGFYRNTWWEFVLVYIDDMIIISPTVDQGKMQRTVECKV
jgi:phosphatidylserine decarboxylase